MKRKILFQYCLMALLTFIGNNCYAQISYSENFNNEDDIEWTNPDDFFWLDDYESCNSYSIVGELYAYYGDGEAISGLIGTSDGQEAQLSYSYKLVDYYDYTAYPNSYEWGSFTIAYGPSATGPWTTIETISPSNNVPSDQCAIRTVNFTPPSGPVYLRLFVDVNEDDFDVDALLYLDDVSVIQGTCNGTPEVAATLTSNPTPCTNQEFILSLSPAVTLLGYTYQWQSSADGVAYSNVPTGGTRATYTTTQPQAMWYRAVVTCTNSGESTNSTPVQVNSTGGVCLCDVEFDEGVEPITYVNFAGINNTTSATVDGTPGVQDFTALAAAQVVTGQTYTITLRGNTAGDYEDFFTVYIDFNQNGDLTDEGESFLIGSIEDSNGNASSQQLTGSITIPDDAMEGIAHMRVFKSYDAPNTDPCSSEEGYGYGQVEDYLVNISAPCDTPAPNAEPLQVVCSGSTVADLSAEGTVIKWYTTATGGTALTTETVLTETTYYVSQIPEGSCESETRTAVTVQFSVIPPPATDETTQVFCGAGTVADLDVEADGDVVWYSAATGGEVVGEATALTNGSTYYASQFIDGCESATRTPVTATISIVDAPEATSPQAFSLEEGDTVEISDIQVTADGSLSWYASQEDAETNTNALDPDTYEIAVGQSVTLYVVQTVGDCVSAPTPITVTATLGSDTFTLAGLTYYPNPVNDVLTISYSNTIDVVEVYNLVGQCVLRQYPALNEVSINAVGLSAGTYLVKVQSGTQAGVIKVVKE